MKNFSSSLAAVSFFLLVISSSSRATLTVYTDQASWQAAVGTASVSVETFSSSTTGNFASTFGPLPFAGFTLSGSANGDRIGIQTGSIASGGSDTPIPSSFVGQNYLGWGNGDGQTGPTTTFAFANGTSAFGFNWFNTDVTDNYQIVITSTSGTTNRYVSPPFTFASSVASTGFWGIVATNGEKITGATISTNAFGGYVSDAGIDNVRVSPSTVATPVITSATSATGRLGQAFSYQITATNNPTSYSVTGTLPAGLNFAPTTGVISGTPTATGSFPVTISATNAGGTGSASLTLTILIPAPVITSATSVTGRAGQAFSYQISASSAPTSYGLSGALPGGLNFDPASGIISGTPTTPGTGSVTISASNAGGTGQATLAITILQAVPAITSASSVSGQVGQAFNYLITATNGPTSFALTGSLPAGLVFNPDTGLISGTPTAAGMSTITVGASNSGGTGSLEVTLNIFVGGTFAVTDPGAVDISKFNPGSGADAEVRTIVFQPDGRALIGGSFTSYRGAPRAGIARANADGTLDTSFNPGSGADGAVNAILLLPGDDRIIIGGDFTSFNGTPRNGLARLNADGSVDASFAPDLGGTSAVVSTAARDDYRPMPKRRAGPGVNAVTAAANNRAGFVTSLAAGPNGSVVIGGAFSTSKAGTGSVAAGVVRVTSTNGQPDPNFANPPSPNGAVRATVTQTDGRTIIGGEFTQVGGQSRPGIARLNVDGSLDGTFDPSGAGATGGPVLALALQDDGAVVLGGDFTQAGGAPRLRIARLKSDGSADPDFDPGKYAPGALKGPDAAVESIVIQPVTKKIVIAGAFSAIADASVGKLGRLNPIGTVDTSFNPGVGTNNTVRAVALRPDGTALVGGDFTQLATTPVTRLGLVGAGEPRFFDGAVGLPKDYFYLAFPQNGNIFGYYTLDFYPFLYHNDMGFLYVFDGKDSANGVYFYDFQSNSFFYTSPSFPWPYLYDFNLQAFLYYFPDANNPQFYTKNPRYFFNFNTGVVITK